MSEQAQVPVIEARGVVKHFVLRPSLLSRVLARARERVVRAVDGVSLNILPGETLGLVGESGCGKTTFGRVLARLYEPTRGEIRFQGKVVVGGNGSPAAPGTSGKEVRPYHRKVQIIFQNPYSSLNPRKTVREILGVPLYHRGLRDPIEREEETIRLMRRVGLSERQIDAYPHQFSGGQRQRIGIARALAMQPEFIVADEPVSALDVSIQAQVINLLEELQEEFRLTYLFIAHDLSVIYYVSDRVAVMYLGKIVETGETEALFEEPRHPYTRALLAAIPSVHKATRRERILLPGSVPSPIDPPSGCPFHPRCFARIGPICEEKPPPLFEVEGQQVACWLYENQPRASVAPSGAIHSPEAAGGGP